MKLVETQTVKANLCTCHKAHKFMVSGEPDLYDQPEKENVLILSLRFDKDKFEKEERPTILQSILIFCDCGNLTIHYPILSNSGAGWKSRKMWKGWRNSRINIEWPLGGMAIKQKTLRNISQLMLTCSDGSMEKGFYFVNDPADGLNIHSRQADIAGKVFEELLTCITYRGFRLNIDYRIRECAWQGMLIANDMPYKHQLLEQVLPDIVQEMYNLRHISKSGRLGDVRNALQKLCADISITLPELLQNDTGQPEVIKQFFFAP